MGETTHVHWWYDGESPKKYFLVSKHYKYFIQRLNWGLSKCLEYNHEEISLKIAKVPNVGVGRYNQVMKTYIYNFICIYNLL